MNTEEQIASLRKKIHDLEELASQPGWKVLLAALDEQVRVRRNEIFALDLNDFSDIFRLSRFKGETAGIQFAMGGCIQMLIDDARTDLDAIITKEREAEDAA